MPERPRWWGPRYPMDAVTAVWSIAEQLPVLRPGTGAAYQALFLALRRVALGRTFTSEVAGERLEVTVDEIVSLLDPVRLIRGHLDVRVALSGIRWGAYEFDQSSAVLRRVALRPGTPPAVSATPVELHVDVPSGTLDAMLGSARPELTIQIDGEGVARIRWARRPRWGNVECDISVESAGGGAALLVTPLALNVAGGRVRVPMGVRGHRLALDRLPPGMVITEVHCRPGALRVHARLPQWQMPR